MSSICRVPEDTFFNMVVKYKLAKNGEWVTRRWDIWNPGLLGTPGRGRREGAESRESRAARGEHVASLRSWGAARSLLCSTAAAASAPLRLQLQLIAAKASLCSLRRPPARAISSGFPNFAVFQPEPIPSGEPLSHLFSRVGFFFFLLLAVKYLRATWSLVLSWLFFSPPPLSPRRRGGLG